MAKYPRKPDDPRGDPRQAVGGDPGELGERAHRDGEGDGQHGGDDQGEQAPAERTRARVRADGAHPRNAEVRGRARTRPSSRRRIAPAAADCSRKSSPAAEPRMTALLAKRLGDGGAGGDDRRLDDVGRCRVARAGVDEVVRSRAEPVDARAGRRDAPAAVAEARRAHCPGQDDDREEAARVARVRDADLPPIARRDAHGDVAVGVDDGARVGPEQPQRAIGQPALAHAVEVEPEARGALHGAGRHAIGDESPGTIGGRLRRLRPSARNRSSRRVASTRPPVIRSASAAQASAAPSVGGTGTAAAGRRSGGRAATLLMTGQEPGPRGDTRGDAPRVADGDLPAAGGAGEVDPEPAPHGPCDQRRGRGSGGAATAVGGSAAIRRGGHQPPPDWLVRTFGAGRHWVGSPARPASPASWPRPSGGSWPGASVTTRTT